MTRADELAAARGLAESRSKARALIEEGKLLCGGKPVDKPSRKLPDDAELSVVADAQTLKFVSRAGLKLEGFLDAFGMDLRGAEILDAGASTGGFTDCMLQHGAKKVYSIDVGYGQLDWRLRNDERVKVMERMNARNMTSDWFDEEVDFASMDVSFISIKLILPAIYNCLKNGALAVILVKPQFEAGKGKVGKIGVVREEATHKEVLLSCMLFAQSLGFEIQHVDYSPITGPKGNIEFLMVLKKRGGDSAIIMQDQADGIARNTVKAAHNDEFIS